MSNAQSSSPLQEIIQKLKASPKENNESYRITLSYVFTLTNSLEKITITLEDFKSFLVNAHNLLITGDSSKRSSLLRAIRLSTQNELFVKCLIEEEIHWIVVTSLERDFDYSMERMQAFKLMEKIRIIAPQLYPISFGRSLVAIANYKEDNFRKICLEGLRELSIANPRIVAAVNGFSALLEAVVEPLTVDMADNILLTLLFLLNDPLTRRIVKPNVDLRILLSPFTDLDSDPAEMVPRWKAAKAALLLMMRSWVGVVLLTSEEMGLPTLVRMLQDPKVPVPTQDVILETIHEIFAPVISKVKMPNRSRMQQVRSVHQSSQRQQTSDGQKLTSSSSSTNLQNLASSSSQAGGGGSSSGPNTPSSDSVKIMRANSGSQLVKQNSGTGLIFPPAPISPYNPKASAAPPPVPLSNKASHRGSFSFSDNIFATLTHHGSSSNMSQAAAASQQQGVPASSSSSSALSAHSSLPVATNKGFSISAFFNPRNSTTSPSGRAGLTRRGSYESPQAPMVAAAPAKKPPILSTPVTASASGVSGGGLHRTPLAKSVSSAITTASTTISGSRRYESFDPIYNMMDSYTALLCSSFLHCNLIQSLFFLGANGSVSLALKSRNLMVNYLRILANIFPENRCSELLTIPSLIEFAATVTASNSRAHKSSQILVALADAFSLMPFKQVSGSHISGLSASASSTRNRSGSGPTQRTGGSVSGGSVYNTMAAAVTSSKSNFVSLNIQTVYELAEEIKIASFSNIAELSSSSSFSSQQQGCMALSSTNSSTQDVIRTLRASLTPVVDKLDFNRQMDQSRVIGKEGKEPFKWDWVAISDMLEYSFHHPDRLSEALKTKWVRRVSGFYRCSVEEKGYFANLDWEPTNLQYLECACNMYSVLLKDDAGMTFLNSDRRGMLFTEIANEIEQLAVVATTKSAAVLAAASKNVFRLYSCTCTMAREFFTLLGRIIRTTESRHLLDSTNIFQHLSKLGGHNTLDYISRLALTSLSFTDGGFLSRHLMQLWTTQTSCSHELRIYFHSLLRILLRCHPVESCNWCVDAIVNQLTADDEAPTEVLYKALEEAIQNKSHLRAIISKRPRLATDPHAQSLLVRFLSVPEGIEYLSQKGYLDSALTAWQSTKCSEYVYQAEEKLSAAFHKFNGKGRPEMLRTLQPIPIETPEFIAAINARQSVYGGAAAAQSGSSLSNSAVKSSAALSDGGTGGVGVGEGSSTEEDPNSSHMVDLHGLLRVPWNIEVRLTPVAGYAGSSVAAQPSNGNIEYMKIDTFLDTTDLSSIQCYETTCDAFRLVKVRGIVLDSKGAPVGQAVAHNKVISSTLLAGICSISRHGKVQCNTENRPQRRKASVANSTRESMAAGRPSITMASAAQALAELQQDSDTPVTLQQDYLYDWSSCKPGHRQGNVCELGDSKFSVSVPGEPVVWIFSRRAPGVAANSVGPGHHSRAGSMSNLSVTSESMFNGNSGRTDHSRSGNLLYLVEVQYYFRLETGHAMFVPMPRHIYGELARTLEGCAHLHQRNVITDLLNVVHRRVADSARAGSTSSLDMRSALWSLGHIGATELGYGAIVTTDPMFIEWCLENISSCPNFSLRGTFFYVVGLLSRTVRGSRKLAQSQWDCAPLGGNSAVAFPRNPSVLFKQLPASAAHDMDSTAMMGNPPNAVKALTPFIVPGTVSVELEILNLIAKLPGVIVYRECKSRLDHLKREHPELFAKRSLYVNVHRMLDSYTFKLTARRDITALFTADAKQKDVAAVVMLETSMVAAP